MKEKIKKIIFNISIFYVVIVLVLMLISYFNATTSIELVNNEENIKELNKLKKELTSLENNSCTKEISKMIEYSENTSYNGKVNLKKVYENLDSKIDYEKLFKVCDVTKEEKDNLSNLFITNMVLEEELYSHKYMFQYELGIKDFYSRMINESDIKSTEYNIVKKNEINIISNLIEIASKGDDINE